MQTKKNNHPDTNGTSEKKPSHSKFNEKKHKTLGGKRLSDVDIIINELTLQAEQSGKKLKTLPLDKITRIIRSHLEAKPENADGVSNEDYFALFEQVVNKIMPSDN